MKYFPPWRRKWIKCEFGLSLKTYLLNSICSSKRRMKNKTISYTFFEFTKTRKLKITNLIAKTSKTNYSTRVHSKSEFISDLTIYIPWSTNKQKNKCINTRNLLFKHKKIKCLEMWNSNTCFVYIKIINSSSCHVHHLIQ